MDDFLPGGFHGFGSFFTECAAGHGEGAGIDITAVGEALGDDGDAAGFIDVGSDELAARLGGQHRLCVRLVTV